jgi:hypothetical protein
MTRPISAALAVVVLLGASLSLWAQGRGKNAEDANLRAVQGVVTDADRNPVPGAIVQLKDMRTLQIRSFVTQAEGNYHFAGLRTDTDYEVRATAGELSSPVRRVSSFDSRKTVIVNLQLEREKK